MGIRRIFLFVMAFIMAFCNMSFDCQAEAESGLKLPKHIYQGEKFYLKGSIKVAYKPVKASLNVFKAGKKGKVFVRSCKVRCKNRYIYLKNTGAKLKFQKLSPGKHDMILYAKDGASGTWHKVVSRSFTVSKIGLKKFKFPTTVKEDAGIDSDELRGRIISYYPIKKVEIDFINAEGKLFKRGRTVVDGISRFKAKYNISLKTLLKKTDGFSKLFSGRYIYKLTVQDNKLKSRKLASGVLDVQENKDYSFNNVKLPKKIMKGDNFSIRGTVRRPYIVAKATAVIKERRSGKIINTASYKVGTKKIDFSKLGSELKFSNLKPGKYTLKISAKPVKRGRRHVLKLMNFSVSDIKSSGFYIPKGIKEKTIPKLRGLVKSYFPLKKVSLSLHYNNGSLIKGCYVSKRVINAHSFAVTKLMEKKNIFYNLKSGRYNYRLWGTDSKDKSKLIKYGIVNIVGKRDFVLSRLIYPKRLEKGKPYSISGIIKGKRRIETVSIGVAKPDGRYVIKVTDRPRKYSYNIKFLDSRLKFGKLKPGKYDYIINVKSEGSAEETVKKKAFTISNIRYKKFGFSSSNFKFKATGTVESQFELKKVAVWLADKNGKAVKGTYNHQNPDRKKVNLGQVFEPVRIKSLKRGIYSIKTYAEDEYGINGKLSSRKFKISKNGLKIIDENDIYGKVKIGFKLKYSKSRLYKIGKQKISGPCGQYAMGYGRMIIDGSLPLGKKYRDYAEQFSYRYGYGKGSVTAIWSRAGAGSVWTRNTKVAYLRAYEEIRNRKKPCIIPVDNHATGNNHFILLIGYVKMKDVRKEISLRSFIALDPASGKEILLKNKPFYADSTRGARYIVFDR